MLPGRLWRGSIRTQLIVGVALVHAVMMTVFVFDLLNRQKQFLMQQSREQALALASTLATNSVSWLLADDVVGLQEVVRSQADYPHVRYAMVLSPDGRVLGHTEPERTGWYVRDQVSRTLLVSPAQRRELVFDPTLVDVAVPVMANTQMIGWARVGIGQDYIASALRQVSRSASAYIAVAIVAGALFAWFMANGLTLGLQRLTRVATKIRAGDASARVGIRRDDELGLLASTFDQMLDAFARQTRAREQDQRQLAKSKAEFEAMFRSIPDAVLMSDLANRVVLVNPAAPCLFGYSQEEMVGTTSEHLYANPEQYAEHVHSRHSPAVFAMASSSYEMVFRRKDGSEFTGHMTCSLVRDDSGQALGFLALIHDISKEKQADLEQKLAAQVFENSSEGIVVTDASNRILMVNRSFTSITGFSHDEAFGRRPEELLHSGRQDTRFYEVMWDSIHALGFWRGEIWNRRKNGEIYPEWLAISLVRNESGKVVNHVGIFSDMTERKLSDERIRFLAQHDALTGLPNRSLLCDRLDQAIAYARRGRHQIAVLFIDFDRFKNINDSMGHQAGDELLVAMGQRLRQCVREKDTVSRLGGDEFVIVLDDSDSEHTAAVVARKILDRVQEHFQVRGQDIALTASIGVSVYPEDGETSEALIKNADAAMYYAKSLGRNNYQFYTAELNARTLERLQMESRLRRAIAGNELRLYYQPQVRCSDGAIIGLEALIRWNQPEFGLVSPLRFIPVAEECGLIVEIGQWVLREACRQNKIWCDAGLLRVPVAVNISALQYQNPQFFMSVIDALEESGLEPRYLELELTESLLMHEAESKLKVLDELKYQAIKLSIDDFGTGYSSLSYLKRFPIDKLKVDKSFVRDIIDDPDDAAIVAAIINMSRSLRLTTIAEGVETPEQFHHIRALGCDEVQGFLISQPLPAEEFEALLRSGRPLLDLGSGHGGGDRLAAGALVDDVLEGDQQPEPDESAGGEDGQQETAIIVE